MVQSFDGDIRFMCAGSTSALNEFRPVQFQHDNIRFLFELYRHRLCCFLAGTFVLFTAGVLNSFDGETLFIALTNSDPLLNFIFH